MKSHSGTGGTREALGPPYKTAVVGLVHYFVPIAHRWPQPRR
jgi:hypothetical protein